MLIKLRESLFKGEKTIIKNGFYKKLKAKNIKKIKKNGAISGCSVMVLQFQKNYKNYINYLIFNINQEIFLFHVLFL